MVVSRKYCPSTAAVSPCGSLKALGISSHPFSVHLSSAHEGSVHHFFLQPVRFSMILDTADSSRNVAWNELVSRPAEVIQSIHSKRGSHRRISLPSRRDWGASVSMIDIHHDTFSFKFGHNTVHHWRSCEAWGLPVLITQGLSGKRVHARNSTNYPEFKTHRWA